MKLQAEWSELLGLLKRHGVRYLVVGGMAVAAHGRERYTKDLDLFVQPSEANVRRLGRALAEPNRIDLLTSVAGVSFAKAWRERSRVATPIGQIPVIGLATLRVNKAASGRPIDRVDLALLDELVLATRAATRNRRTRRPAAARSSRTRGTRRR